MQLFYAPNLFSGSKNFTFDTDESKHIAKVLRKKVGDKLHITNGLGFGFEGEISLITDKKCEISLLKETFYQPEKTHLHIAVAPTKMNDRMEWFLEKATEIGIQEITPIICDRSERKVINHDRFEKIMQAAMKQSVQFYMPKLNEQQTFKQFLSKKDLGISYIAHCEEVEKQELKNILQPSEKITIVIGPEGDFSVLEIQKAIENNFTPISLGNNRLRTETAALVACHTVRLLLTP